MLSTRRALKAGPPRACLPTCATLGPLLPSKTRARCPQHGCCCMSGHSPGQRVVCPPGPLTPQPLSRPRGPGEMGWGQGKCSLQWRCGPGNGFPGNTEPENSGGWLASSSPAGNLLLASLSQREGPQCQEASPSSFLVQEAGGPGRKPGPPHPTALQANRVPWGSCSQVGHPHPPVPGLWWAFGA